MRNHNGYYKVKNDIFHNKFLAVIEASKQKSGIEWIYYNDVFEKACANFKNYDMSLEEMYKQRALQLREQYDYLILNYSGGSDSHNILEVFLRNNIKLDHLYIQWPMSLTDKGLYTPNNKDTSNYNFRSEWDLVLKKDLEWIGKNRPEIKIEIADWSLTVKESFYNDDLYTKNVTNLPSIARSQKQNTFSETERVLSNKGLKVASIYGVDKPFIMIKDDVPYFRFADNTFMTRPNIDNPDGLEYFYFTPSMPEIPILQAYKLYQYYKINRKNYHLVVDYEYRKKHLPGTLINFGTHETWYKEFALYNEIFKLVCYPYWDFNRFQADKPIAIIEGLPMGVRPHDNILSQNIPEFNRIQQKWEYLWKSYKQEIDETFLINQDTIRALFSKWHKLSL
jgi:hypothetical protein